MTEEALAIQEKAKLESEALELQKLYAIRAADCYDSFYEFFIEFWDIVNQDADLVVTWYHKYLCDELQEIVERAIAKQPKKEDVIINISPGSTKSTIVSQMLGAWIWPRAPHFVIITSTHSNDLSVDQSLKSKDIVKSDRWNKYFQPRIYRDFGKYLYFTKDNEKDWRNNFGGVRFFTSVQGSVIGKHAHLLLWDDVIDVEKANSEAVRDKANRHVSKTLPSRKKDKEVTPTIGIMQRLHEDDATGYLLKINPKIRHIKLPAEDSGDIQPPELRKYYVDGLIDPVRLPRRVLKEQEVLLGQYSYAGQYAQNPTPKGGGKIKYEWFNYLPAHELPDGLVWDIWADGAYTKNTDNDPTGLMVCAYDKRQNRLYIKNFKGEYLELPDLLKEIPRYCEIMGVGSRSRIWIEPKASGHSLQQMLREVSGGVSALLIKSKLVAEGKEGRLAVASPKVEGGNIWLVEGAWTDKFTGQLCGFPVVTHDEAVDCLGYAVDYYFTKGGKKGVKRRN